MHSKSMRAEIGRDQISAAGGGRCAAAGVLKLETPAFAGIRHEWPLKFSWSCRPGGFEAAAWGLRCTNRWVKSDTGSERTPNEVRYGGYVLRTWGAAQALATSPFLSLKAKLFASADVSLAGRSPDRCVKKVAVVAFQASISHDSPVTQLAIYNRHIHCA